MHIDERRLGEISLIICVDLCASVIPVPCRFPYKCFAALLLMSVR
jgi:hypothetical protein